MVFHCRQIAYLGASDISADSLFAEFFKINLLPNYTAFTSLYDQYKVISLTYHYYPTIVNNLVANYVVATGVNTYTRLPAITSCVDYDDATSPASENVILDHANAIDHGTFTKVMTRTFAPRIATEVYQTGGFGGYANNAATWIDSASPAVEHYGLKVFIGHGANFNASSNFVLRYVEATLAFRKVF